MRKRGRGRGEAREEEEQEFPNLIPILVALCAHWFHLSRQTQLEDLAINIGISLCLHMPLLLFRRPILVDLLLLFF